MSISEEEKLLFRNSQSKITPLKSSNKISRSKKTPKVQPKQPSSDPDELPINYAAVVNEITADETLHYHQDGLQAKTLRALQQGKLRFEAKLDLHGMTVNQAELALQQLLQQAVAKQYRVLHIIHGKGYTSQQQYPPLKNLVNRFLRQCPLVLAFTSAPRQQGGVGAVNVLLKRTPAPI